MSAHIYNPRAATIVVDGVTLPNPRMIFRNDPHAEEIVLDASGVPVLRPASREEIASSIHRALLTSVARGVLPEAAPIGAYLSRFIGRRLGGAPRGCFHEGCDEADGEEGGSHWCRLVTWYGRAR